jgi:hypothetical protein
MPVVCGQPGGSVQRYRTTVPPRETERYRKTRALSRLDLLSRGWRGILPADNLRDPAKSLLDRHELRQPIAYNSLRL